MSWQALTSVRSGLLAERRAGVAWLAFVNPDCLVEGDSLSRLRAHALATDGDVLLGADLVDAAGVRDGAARHGLPMPRLFVEPGRSIAGKAAVTAGAMTAERSAAADGKTGIAGRTAGAADAGRIAGAGAGKKSGAASWAYQRILWRRSRPMMPRSFYWGCLPA